MKEENMDELNFNSQICTSREQSERLLALGLKKETADMCWTKMAAIRGTFYVPELAPINMVSWRHTPAWSLHRLIEMIDDEFVIHLNNFTISGHVFRVYNDLYDNIIECITYLINAGHFNKEYLEE